MHICEVDRLPWIILRLPDDLVFRLRDDLLRELTRPFRPPIPIPDPPPFAFDPGFIDPSPENLARSDNLRTRVGLLQRSASSLEQVALNPQPLPPRTAGLERVALNPQPLPPRTAGMEGAALNPQPEPPIAASFMSLPAASRAALTSQSAGIVRQSLLSQIDLIRPYLCLWPWFWWWWYRCDEIAVLETNAQGRFETTYWYPCFGDRPDIYVWVEFFIGGVWTTVYRPPIACNTHWDYTCGSDLTIYLTDPRVPVCGDPGDSPGKSVTVMAIGENVSTHEIRMSAGSLQGLTAAGEPFGGVLEPRVQFGRTALFAAGITHYRWSYRRLTLSDGSTAASDPDFHHLNRSVIRHYAMPSGVMGVGPSYPTESMGPEFGAADVFKIQPLAPSAPGNDGWAIMDSHEDNATAFFESQLLNAANPEAVAGKYELKLELFRIVGGVPTPVNLTDEGIDLFIPDQDAPFGAATITTTAPASAEYYFRDPVTLKKLAFRLVVHIDNNICHGNIIDVSVGGVGAGSCGFISYTPGASALVSFMASHPHQFATFDFHVYRGSGCAVDEAQANGGVGDASANGFARIGTVFSKTIPVATLLDSTTDPVNCPPCGTKAAFAETLWVYALATDGWYRLYALDAPRGGPTERANKAFALEPAGP